MNSCSPNPGPPAPTRYAFTYDQSQQAILFLYATGGGSSSCDPTCNGGTATFAGFDLYNSSGALVDFVSAASVITDITAPEPSSATLCLAATALAAGLVKRRRATSIC